MTTFRLPDWLNAHPVRVIATYGAKSAVEVNGVELILPTVQLVPVQPEPVPAGIAGYPIGTRHGGAS